MSIPSRIIVAGHPITVALVDDSDAPLAHGADRGTVGTTNVGKGSIRLSARQSTHNMRDTLLHEVLHAVLICVSLDEQKDVFVNPRMNERVIEVLGTHLLDTMRRNPDLVDYLMADGDAA